MNDPATPQTLASEFADLKRRLSALERSPQLKSSSIKGGKLKVYDSSGNSIMEAGEIGIDGDTTTSAGMTITTPGGHDVFRVSADRGLTLPALTYPWRDDPNTSTAITSASWTTVFESRVEGLSGDALRSDWVVTLDSGVSADVRVMITAGSVVTDTVSIAYATSSSWTFALAWLHGKNLGSGPFIVRIDAKRTAGAANVNVYRPYHLSIQDGYTIGATSGGLTAS
jgi:hypothetical protein